ncbi:MAG TPA: HAMP domain-containing sensor histidine kinase [Geothrix sp.]
MSDGGLPEHLDGECAALAAKAQMAAYIAHEINGPLAGIKSAITLLGTAVSPDHPHHPYLGLVDREIDRIAATIRMMYELHRPKAEGASSIAVAVLFQDLASLLGTRLRARRVSLDTRQEASDLPDLPQAGLLRQVLFNLLQNAIEATPLGGTVVCAARWQGGGIELEVRDQGPGLSSELLEHIWMPGFTLKRSSVQAGLGLGLSGCRRVVEGLGGSIHTENPPEGGCVFLVRFPTDHPTHG